MIAVRHAEPAAAPVRIEGAASSGAPAASHGGGGKEELYVDVAGAVRRPGLLRVPDGARVATAIARAGGATRSADLTAVNLAQPREDGQQVVVPQKGGAIPSLGTASAAQLEELDGIGPALAKRIVEYRQAHGGFRSLEELGEVDGIGEKRLAALRKALRP